MKVRKEHPGIRVIVHPECRFEVAQAADEIGSTEGIVKSIRLRPSGTEWAVGTEIHLVNRLGKEHEAPQSDVAGSKRVRVHHDVSDNAAAPAVGAGKPCGG